MKLNNGNNVNFPDWLARNPIFRKLFLLRKLYLTKSKAHHYSQFAEDVSIKRFFPKKYQGFYVDVGCYHPKKHSNTWQLFKNGWRGINVDIDAIKIEAFNIVRPDDTNIACAVSDADGEFSYYSNGFYSLTTTLDDSGAGQQGYIEKKVKCRRLTDIIDDSPYKDREIDLLSVDAEGHDLEVLKSLDFDRYAPRLLAVETFKPLFSQVVETDLYKFLAAKGYCLVGWNGLTLLLASPVLQESLTEDWNTSAGLTLPPTQRAAG